MSIKVTFKTAWDMAREQCCGQMGKLTMVNILMASSKAKVSILVLVIVKMNIGVYTHLDGGKYVGGWNKGKREGHGIFTFASGAKYYGYWREGNMEGYGTYTYANGS